MYVIAPLSTHETMNDFCYQPKVLEDAGRFDVPNNPYVPQESQYLGFYPPDFDHLVTFPGGIQEDWNRGPSVLFFTRGRPGVKLLDAENGEFEEIDDRDVIVLEYRELSYYYHSSITIDIHVSS